MPKLFKNGQIVQVDAESSSETPILTVETDLDTLSLDWQNIELICIEFPGFMDGRPFSIARSIRDHFDYKGELRATGKFIPDQLHYLSRCGFDAFLFEEDIEDSVLKECVAAFTTHYQAAVDDPQPLFRKRA